MPGPAGPTAARQARRNVIAIGGSAGALDAMMALVAGLPPDFAGSVLVVSHIGANRSHLPELLARAGRCRQGMPRTASRSVPGSSMSRRPTGTCWSADGQIRLSRGPRQHFTRPAIDPLFRSAAQAFGPRVDRGRAERHRQRRRGRAREIQQAGGIAVIQDPAGGALSRDAAQRRRGGAGPITSSGSRTNCRVCCVRLSARDGASSGGRDGRGRSTKWTQFERPMALTCPECGGAMRRTGNGPVKEFRCHTGHRFGATEVADGQSSAVEQALVVAVRVLNERAELCRQMMDNARAAGRDWGSRTGAAEERGGGAARGSACGSSNTSRRRPRRNRTASRPWRRRQIPENP